MNVRALAEPTARRTASVEGEVIRAREESPATSLALAPAGCSASARGWTRRQPVAEAMDAPTHTLSRLSGSSNDSEAGDEPYTSRDVSMRRIPTLLRVKAGRPL